MVDNATQRFEVAISTIIFFSIFKKKIAPDLMVGIATFKLEVAISTIISRARWRVP